MIILILLILWGLYKVPASVCTQLSQLVVYGAGFYFGAVFLFDGILYLMGK